MKFRITRTSDRSPCEEATEKSIKHATRREKTLKMLANINTWEVEIIDLPGLLAFCKKYDEPVIIYHDGENEFSLEIYDEDRE